MKWLINSTRNRARHRCSFHHAIGKTIILHVGFRRDRIRHVRHVFPAGGSFRVVARRQKDEQANDCCRENFFYEDDPFHSCYSPLERSAATRLKKILFQFFLPTFRRYATFHCQLSTVNCQLNNASPSSSPSLPLLLHPSAHLKFYLSHRKIFHSL